MIGTGTTFSTTSAPRSLIWRGIHLSRRQGSWLWASPTGKAFFRSQASTYYLLKAYDLIPTPAYVLIKVADSLKDETTATNQLWPTDLAYLKLAGSAWYYLPTVRDDLSRHFVTWNLCATK